MGINFQLHLCYVAPMNKSASFPSLCGKFLIAMPGMGDQRFDRSVIYLCAHSDEGAMGFIFNQLLETPNMADFFQQLEIIGESEINLLPEETRQRPLFVGGPVEPGRGFVLHTPEYDSDSTLHVEGNVRLTATLDILRAIAVGKGPNSSIIALGYAGWAAGQLEDEIASNGWLTVDADESLIFEKQIDERYEACLALLGVKSTSLSSDIGHA